MKSRRIERKNARKEKKFQKNLYFKNKSKFNVTEESVDKSDEVIEKIDVKKDEKRVKFKIKEKNDRNVGKNQKKLSFKQKRDIEREDKEIKRLEKLLKLNRRKRKGKKVTTLPKSFKLEGLDYILDVVDSNKTDQISEAEEMVPSEEENEEDFDASDNENQDNSEEDNDEDSDQSDRFDEELESDVNSSDDDMDVSEDIPKEKPKTKEELKEDIYGFIRDSSGNIVKTNSDSKEKYVNKESGVSEQLLRRVRGSLNRLTVNNIMVICGQFKELFEQNSRHSVNEALFSCINSSLLDLDYMSPPKMKSESALLISILHNMFGEEVGGYAIHSCICKFNEFIQQKDWNQNKRIDNLVVFILNLYVCGLIESLLVYEIMTKLSENFTEKSIELINLILKSVGFVLRKDNATKMKELILKIQNEAKNIDKTGLSGSRITFLLDSLIAIKNNNMSKLNGYGTEIDLDLIETTLKSTIKKSRVNSISGTFDAVLHSSHWYSYTQNIETIISNEKQFNELKSEITVENQINDQLFKALRLNTPLRKSIVLALSSCNDYIDAANRLISIGKKQFSEVINVLLHVCIHENKFNPFYSHLLNHLSKCDRKYKIALDFSIRDKIEDLESIKPKERHILGQLIFNLMKLNALAITCLKVVHFSDMNKSYVEFIKCILTPVLDSEQLIEQILSKIPTKDSFATAIRLFINCFIEPKDRNKLDIKRLCIKQK